MTLDLVGLTTRERHGYTEAVCPGCEQWLRLGEYYKGPDLVIRVIQHTHPCEHFERVSRQLWEQENGSPDEWLRDVFEDTEILFEPLQEQP